MEAIVRYPSIYASRRKFYYFRTFIELRNDLDWFESLDRLRQDGMYSDFRESLKSPKDLNQELYSKVCSKLNVIRKFGLEMIKAYENMDDNMRNKVEKMNKNLFEEDVYEKLDAFLKKNNTRKETYFSKFRNGLK